MLEAAASACPVGEDGELHEVRESNNAKPKILDLVMRVHPPLSAYVNFRISDIDQVSKPLPFTPFGERLAFLATYVSRFREGSEDIT